MGAGPSTVGTDAEGFAISMFENLARHLRILITGPQRSGTTIAGQMIAHDTGFAYVDESDYGVFDERGWRQILRRERVVVQCPHMLKRIVDAPMDDSLVVLMRRDLAQIHQSEERVGWKGSWGHLVELAQFDLQEGDISAVKYAYWDEHVKPPFFLELRYDSLRDHPFFIESPQRASFGAKETGR